MKKNNGKKSLVLRSYERRPKPKPGPGEFIQEGLHAGEGYIVFCSRPDCPHYHGNQSALPHWVEDCPAELNLLRCPECKAPVVRLPPDEEPPE